MHEAVVSQTMQDRNIEFDRSKNTFDFDQYTLSEIQMAYHTYKKGREHFAQTFDMLSAYYKSQENEEVKKKNEKVLAEKRRSSHVIG